MRDAGENTVSAANQLQKSNHIHTCEQTHLSGFFLHPLAKREKLCYTNK